MKKKHYIAIITPVILLILLVTFYIYYNINNELSSIDNSTGLIVPGKEPEYHFAMICENVEDSTWLSIKKGIERASADFNAAVETNWSAISTSGEQARHMDMAIASKVDGIITYVWNEDQAGKIIDTAVEQGIPVVTIGIDAKNSKRTTFVGMNSYGYGQELARMLLGAIGDRGDAVVLVSNSQIGGTVVQNLTISGIKNALKPYPNITVTTIEYNQSDVLGIEDTIKDLLTNRPDLDAIVCTSAKDTAVVAQRLIDLNKVGYSIIGYGDTPEILRYIDNGVVYGTVMASHEEMGYNAVKALYNIKTTGRASAYFTVNTSLITKTNVSEYLEQGEE